MYQRMVGRSSHNVESPHKVGGAEAENRVKRVKEWREKEGVKWDNLILPSTLFFLRLEPQPMEGDQAREELEARRKAEEAEERRVFAKEEKYKETQLGPAPKLVMRERV